MLKLKGIEIDADGGFVVLVEETAGAFEDDAGFSDGYFSEHDGFDDCRHIAYKSMFNNVVSDFCCRSDNPSNPNYTFIHNDPPYHSRPHLYSPHRSLLPFHSQQTPSSLLLCRPSSHHQLPQLIAGTSRTCPFTRRGS